MDGLRNRLKSHSDKIQKLEEMEAALEGVFSQEAQSRREQFTSLVQRTVKPAFDEFKTALREIGRDAVIITSLTHTPVPSIGLTLLDRYLSFGAGKTLKLVNPKEDISKGPTTKFYEIYQAQDNFVCVRQRTDPGTDPIVTQVPYSEIIPKFLENELAAFFERAYPTPN
jgi:hypothetical protein